MQPLQKGRARGELFLNTIEIGAGFFPGTGLANIVCKLKLLDAYNLINFFKPQIPVWQYVVMDDDVCMSVI